MYLAPDALIHHLPIAQDPVMGCPAVIVFYRFWLWSDAWISPVNGAVQIHWVYLYKYFNKKKEAVLVLHASPHIPLPPLPELLIVPTQANVDPHYCPGSQEAGSSRAEEKNDTTFSVDVLLNFSPNIFHFPGLMLK